MRNARYFAAHVLLLCAVSYAFNVGGGVVKKKKRKTFSIFLFGSETQD